jgi:hypothetical protein
LVQGDQVSVVRLEIVPPEQYGPKLDHALNPDDLARVRAPRYKQPLLKGCRTIDIG